MNDDQTTTTAVADAPALTGDEVVDTAKDVLAQEPAMNIDTPAADAPAPMDPPADVPAPTPEENPAPEAPLPDMPPVETPMPEAPAEAPAPSDDSSAPHGF